MAADPHVALCVLTADCAPLALASPEGVFGAVHAGLAWSGGGRRRGGGGPPCGTWGATEVVGGLGPCIHAVLLRVRRGPTSTRWPTGYGGQVRARTTGASRTRPAGRRACAAGDAPGAPGRPVSTPARRAAAGTFSAPGPRRHRSPGAAGLVACPEPGSGDRARRAAPTSAFAGFARAAGRHPLAHRGGVAGPAGVTWWPSPRGSAPRRCAAALAAGLTAVGENYADELVAKAGARWAATRVPSPSGTTSVPSSATRCRAWPRWSPVGRPCAGCQEGGAIAARRPGRRGARPGGRGRPARAGGCAPAGVPANWWPHCGPGPRRGRTDGRGAPGPPEELAAGVPGGHPPGRRARTCRSGRWG